ncbi:MAG TPA: hypothetical protein VMV03_01665, partial [Spirochaetia bacterium]|nr:hypothetical protein [Spirochaetia bacterium]
DSRGDYTGRPGSWIPRQEGVTRIGRTLPARAEMTLTALAAKKSTTVAWYVGTALISPKISLGAYGSPEARAYVAEAAHGVFNGVLSPATAER